MCRLSCGSGNFTSVKAKEKIISKAGWDGLGLLDFSVNTVWSLCWRWLIAPTWRRLLGLLPAHEYFIIVAKRGRVLGATACHSDLPTCSQDKHKEPGLFLGLITLAAQNWVLGMMDFPAAFTWVWTDHWGCAGSEHSLKNKGLITLKCGKGGKNTIVGKAVNSCTFLPLKLRVCDNSLALRADLQPSIYGSY